VKTASQVLAVFVADNTGKNVVFPVLWLTAENQSIDFPYFYLSTFTRSMQERGLLSV
jgi:hypothetical protein